LRVRQFRPRRAFRRLETGDLGRRAVFAGKQTGAYADVLGEGVGDLVLQAGLVGLEAEAPHLYRAGFDVENIIGSAAVFRGQREDFRFRDRFQQAEPEHRRRVARRDRRLRLQRPESQVFQCDARAAHRHRGSVGEIALEKLVTNDRAAFSGHARNAFRV